MRQYEVQFDHETEPHMVDEDKILYNPMTGGPVTIDLDGGGALIVPWNHVSYMIVHPDGIETDKGGETDDGNGTDDGTGDNATE